MEVRHPDCGKLYTIELISHNESFKAQQIVSHMKNQKSNYFSAAIQNILINKVSSKILSLIFRRQTIFLYFLAKHQLYLTRSRLLRFNAILTLTPKQINLMLKKAS